MSRRDRGLLITGLAAILFGCPGMLCCATSPLLLLAQTDPSLANDSGPTILAAVFCLFGLLAVLVPVGLGVYFLRPRPAEPVSPADLHEDLPPPI